MRKKSTNGYKDNSSNKYKDNLIINSNNITMDGVSQKLMAVELDKEGKIIGTKFMKPNNGEYNFPKAQNIMEIPQYKKGGKQKLYTQDDLDAYLAMYMNGGELPKYQTGSQFELADMNNNGMGLENYLPSYLNNSNIQQNSYEGLGPVAYNPTQNQATPTQKQQVSIPQVRPNIEPIKGIQPGFAPDDIQKQIEVANEKPSQEIKESINPEQRQGIELTNNPNIQFFNQYQGVDIPTAAHTLGTSIESGDTLGTVASSLKLATGLGRNIMGGLGQQRQYKRQQQDYYEKAGEHSPANSYERGGQYQDDLSNYMNMVDPIDPKDKKLTPEQIKALNKASGVEFTEEGANSIFEQIPEKGPAPVIPNLDYGKYKDVGYFNSNYNELTGEYDVYPTKNNPANAQLYKDNLRYLQQMNPNAKINTRGHDSGYIPLSERKEFQKGGQYQGNEYRTGLDEEMLTNEQKQLLNAETEAGEYIKDPTTEKVSEIVGDKHSQGGEKMVMKQGEKVLTDHTKLGAKNAKYIKETYDIDIKAKNTYSDVLDKIRSKTGLKKLVQEEEDYIKKLEKLSDKDKVTGSINTKFLEEKLGEVRAKKEPLEKVRQSVFDDLYNIQESNKAQENQKEFQIGGRYTGEGNAIDTVPQGQSQNGQFFGNVDEQKYAETIKNNPWFDFTNFNPSNPEDVARFQTQYNRLSTKGTQVKVDGKFGEQTQTIKLPQEILNTIPLAPTATRNPLDAITTGNVQKVGVREPIAQPDIQELIDSGASEEEVRQAMNVALLPNQYPMAPNSLEPTIKQNRSYERFNPALIDPSLYLEQLQRSKKEMERKTEGMPSQVRQAALQNVQANTQKAANDIMLKIDTQNVNSKNSAEQMNTRIGNRQVDANAQDQLMFEGRALTAKSNTDRDYQNYFNKGMEVNLQNYRDINALNRSNATHDVQFDGQNYIKSNAPDFSKYYEMSQQLAKYQQEQEELEKNKKKSKK